jgi:phosphatidylglycerophosphatase A
MKKNLLYKTISTAMGLGLIPLAPGTFGALGGLAIGFCVQQFTGNPNLILSIVIILFFFIGVYCAGKLIPEWGKDPSCIVIDEVVGMWVSILFLPHNIILLLATFVVFRFFDIVKLLYIWKFEKIRGGWGIMLDDLVAGIITNAIIRFGIFIITCLS